MPRAFLQVMVTAVCALLLVPALLAKVPVPIYPDPPNPSVFPMRAAVMPAEYADDHLFGQVRIDTLGKSVEIAWSYDDSATGERVFFSETFAVTYWPTAAARINDDRLTEGTHFLVSGKRATDGKTLIQRWDLSLSYLPSDDDPTLTTRTNLIVTNLAGRRGVRIMHPLAGVEGQVLVQFDDSDDLHVLDASTGSLQLLFTPAQVPELATDTYRHLWSAEHSTFGYGYVYQCDLEVYDDGALLFYDSDKNGTIDGWLHVPNHEWDTIGQAAWARFFDE